MFPVVYLSDSLISYQRLAHVASYVLLITTALVVNMDARLNCLLRTFGYKIRRGRLQAKVMALNITVSQSCCIIAREHVRCLVESSLLFFHVHEADWKIRVFISILSILLRSR